MTNHSKLILALTGALWLIASPASAADGSWKFEPDARGNPILAFSENGSTVFTIACGRAFGLGVKYPGIAKKAGKATITIAGSQTTMKFNGEFEAPEESSATNFMQWDLGFRRQDPQLYGKRWNAIKSRLLDVLTSGAMVSAGKASYKLPAVNVSSWREPFDACG